MKWPLQNSYGYIIACDKKPKETQTSFFLCIQGNIYKGVNNCGLSIIVENAPPRNSSCMPKSRNCFKFGQLKSFFRKVTITQYSSCNRTLLKMVFAHILWEGKSTFNYVLPFIVTQKCYIQVHTPIDKLRNAKTAMKTGLLPVHIAAKNWKGQSKRQQWQGDNTS